VKAHGGVISIDSENEAGSKLTIQLKKRWFNDHSDS
jgi:signal transduction histidine kinase